MDQNHLLSGFLLVLLSIMFIIAEQFKHVWLSEGNFPKPSHLQQLSLGFVAR